jgi:hypothetical protein
MCALCLKDKGKVTIYLNLSHSQPLPLVISSTTSSRSFTVSIGDIFQFTTVEANTFVRTQFSEDNVTVFYWSTSIV